MPEGPEVETIVRQLKDALKNETWTITGDVLYFPKIVKEGEMKSLLGETITGVERKGKYIVISLGTKSLVIHLGMTGTLALEKEYDTVVHTPRWDYTTTYNSKYRRMAIYLRGNWPIAGLGKALVMYDVRKFGRVYVYTGGAQVVAGIATDITVISNLDWERVMSTNGSKRIKDLLLDQSIVSGIGNIYANEGLNFAGIHPMVRVKDLSEQERGILLKSLKSVIAQGIHNGGTTFRDFGDLYGNKGRNQEHLAVFGREGEPCRLCTNKIVRLKGARSSFVCTRCQAYESERREGNVPTRVG